MNNTYDKKTVIITGSSRGIGAATALYFAEKGFNIVINYVSNKEAADNLSREINEKYPVDTLVIKADVSNESEVINMLQLTKERFGRVDVLINNAGIAHSVYSVNETEEDWGRVINLNLTSQFFVAQTIAKELMLPAKSGKIINMCSLGGIMGMATAVAYSSSKGAVMQMTKSLACEWARFGITVNCVCPGFVETALIEENLKNEKWLGYMTMRTPMRRLAKPEDVAGTILFLSSDMASYITGASVVIDGGFSCGA